MVTPTRKIALGLPLAINYYRGILRGISAFSLENKHWSLCLKVDNPYHRPNFQDWKCDGLIVDFDNSKIVKAALAAGKPVVAVGGGGENYDPQSRIPYVFSDDESIARMAVDHLLDCGLQHFAYCGYTANRTNGWSARRAAAFAARLAAAGHRCKIFNGCDMTGRNWERAQTELMTWLRTLPKPIGILTCNDWRARDVFDACRIAGIQIPDDVAVIGVDNDQLLCELTDPPLSSVEQDCFGVGYHAAATLDKMMRGQTLDQSRYLVPPVGVIARQSTNLLAVDDPVLAAAVRLVRAEACRGLTTASLARQVGLSRSTLDIRFKHRFTRTVDQELRRVRLAYALDLLARSQMPLGDVARAACLGNAEYLNALMQKKYQMTPGQYRQSQQHAIKSTWKPVNHRQDPRLPG